jgi:adenylate kinase
MSVNVIAVFGISGAGKSSLIRDAVKGIDGILHLTASTLIKQGLSDTSVTSEKLRKSTSEQVSANQRILVAMFDRAVAEHQGGLVIFDGHVIIDTDAELIEVPLDVVAAIRPRTIVHVEASPEAVAERRQRDGQRTRPRRTIPVLAEHQLRSRELCQRYAGALCIDMHIIADGRPETLRATCVRLLNMA